LEKSSQLQENPINQANAKPRRTAKAVQEHGILENRNRKPIVQFRKFDHQNPTNLKTSLGQDYLKYAESKICPRKTNHRIPQPKTENLDRKKLQPRNPISLEKIALFDFKAPRKLKNRPV
jgi:hypothetical protein